MRAITTFVSGLLLSTLCLLPVSSRAAEVQPFFALKVSSVNTLVGVAEKIGTMAGVTNDAQFQEIIGTLKDLKGFDFDSIFGIAAAVGSDGSICPILLLPITDLSKAAIPSHPQIFDMLRPYLVKNGENTEINSPFGTFVVIQKKGYLVIVPEDVATQLPSDPRKLFADLDKYTLGIKLDFDKVDFDTLETNLFGPLAFLATMQDPDAGEQLENVLGVVRELFKEFSALSGGIAINPQTADIELSGTAIPRKGSDSAKVLAGYKEQPTIFGGFRGTPGNVIFSFGDSAKHPPFPKQNALMTPAMGQWETILEGILEQIDMEDTTGDVSRAVKEAIGLLKNIMEAEAKRGVRDFAVSFDTSGTLMCAVDLGSLAEIRQLAEMIMYLGRDNLPSDVISDLVYDLRQDYTTVEGFQVSGTKIPVARLLETVMGSAPDAVRDVSLGVFWAIKDTGDKHAIALAVGPNFSKTEQTFISALEKTKTPVPVQKPQGTFDIRALGQLLQPLGDVLGDSVPEARKVLDILASAGNDATISFSVDVKPDRVEGGYRISGKAIQAVLSLVKLAMDSGKIDIPFSR
jgi:hypothetical protein